MDGLIQQLNTYATGLVTTMVETAASAAASARTTTVVILAATILTIGKGPKECVFGVSRAKTRE